MRRNFVFIGVLLGFLILGPPAFATSFSGFSTLDWGSLTMSGIGFTQSDLRQGMQVEVRHSAGGASSSSSFSNGWVTSAVDAALPSIGSASANASSAVLSSSLSLLTSQSSGVGHADRDVAITALNTGVFTVSIPYVVHVQGPISGNWSLFSFASIQFLPSCCGGAGSIADAAGFNYDNVSLSAIGETKSGLLSIAIPFERPVPSKNSVTSRVLASHR